MSCSGTASACCDLLPRCLARTPTGSTFLAKWRYVSMRVCMCMYICMMYACMWEGGCVCGRVGEGVGVYVHAMNTAKASGTCRGSTGSTRPTITRLSARRGTTTRTKTTPTATLQPCSRPWGLLSTSPAWKLRLGGIDVPNASIIKTKRKDLDFRLHVHGN